MNKAAKWLRDKRKDEGLSLRMLGDAIDANHTTIAEAEEGKATTRTWIKLAEYFHESVLNVLYWANEIKQPPSTDDVIREMQDRIITRIIESFPENQQSAVLGRILAEVDWLHESQKQENQSRATSQKYT